MPNVLFKALGCVPPEELARRQPSRAHYPLPDRLDGRHVAVVGSGPSILNEGAFIVGWLAGPIWCMNGTIQHFLWHGNAWAFSVDPKPVVAKLFKGAERVIVGRACDRAVFDGFDAVDLRAFDVLATPRGPTSATAAPHVAVSLGAHQVTFFGCESSYRGDATGYRTHSYMQQPVEKVLEVQCGPKTYLTKPEFCMQAEFLAELIRRAPGVFKERSGGFLRALVKHGDYQVVRVSPALERDLQEQAAKAEEEEAA